MPREAMAPALPAQRGGRLGEHGRSEDSSAGQIIIVIARWLLIATGLAITLWSPAQQDIDKIKISLFLLLGLAFGNFYLHAQILMRRPVLPQLVYGASAVDIAVITVIIVAYGGLAASMFVFYYPALLAFALVFPLSITAVFTLGLLAVYAVAALPPTLPDADLQIFVARLISLAGVAVVGNMYQRIERERCEAAMDENPLMVSLSNHDLVEP